MLPQPVSKSNRSDSFSLTETLKEISKAKKEPEVDLLLEALRIGILNLWRESVLEQFLQRKISKAKAIKALGPEIVNRAEKEKEYILEDIKWVLR